MGDLLNKMGNLLMKPLLRSRLHSLVSKHYLLISFTGRKSGKLYSTPVEYMREGDVLTFFTQRQRTWWKNLQQNAPVTVRICGQDYHTSAEIILDPARISASFRKMHASFVQAPDFAAKTVMVRVPLKAG